MSSTTPDDGERPVTRREFRALALLTGGALFATALALFCLLALEIKG
ncbi:hypothetical protein [Streptomyces noursei]|nr:hypothetical protein [Streptomyces noursei]